MEKLFVIQHASGGEILRLYEGMSADVVTGLLAGGDPFDFVTQEDYEAALEAIPPVQLY